MRLLNLIVKKCVAIHTKYQDYQINNIVKGNPDQAWNKIKKLWSQAKMVYRGPTGFSATVHIEYLALEKFINKYNSEPFFVKGLEEKNPFVVGYCLEGLLLIKSSTLENLPDSILKRQEKITSQISFLISRDTLGHLAHLYTEWYAMEKKKGLTD